MNGVKKKPTQPSQHLYEYIKKLERVAIAADEQRKAEVTTTITPGWAAYIQACKGALDLALAEWRKAPEDAA